MAQCPECRLSFEAARRGEQEVRDLELPPESIHRHRVCGHVAFYRGLGGPLVRDPPWTRSPRRPNRPVPWRPRTPEEIDGLKDPPQPDPSESPPSEP